MVSENVIAKGNYHHSQIGNFISVKNYIFLRKKGVKCLLLRFYNELGYTVDAMSYIVFQYDADGNLLGRRQVRHGDVKLNPLSTYATTEPLQVDEKCTDFKVVFLEVRSGKYRYRVVDQIVSVCYTSSEALFDPEEETHWEPDEPIRGYSVKRKVFGNEKRAALVALIFVLMLITLNVLNMLFCVYRTNDKNREDSSYSESDDNQKEKLAVNFDDGEQYVEV